MSSPNLLRFQWRLYSHKSFQLLVRPDGRDFKKRYSGGTHGGYILLYWAAVFLIIAIIAAVLGFAGVATAAAGIAKILFYIFLIFFLVALVMGFGRRGRV